MAKKIFELAKELDKGAIDLVEELKQFGFDVRNHMASLTDEEVTKALEMFAAKKEEESKVTKKKVVKKKAKKKVATAKKKVTKKEAASKEGKGKTEKKVSASASDASDKKKTVVRKKTVIRKKSGSKESTPTESVESLEEAIAAAPQTETTSAPATETPVDDGSGLRVVSRPVVQAPVETATTEGDAEESEESKQYYKEKVHKFTPVYIPTKEEQEAKKAAEAEVKKKAEAAASSAGPKTAATGDDQSAEGGDGEKKKEETKKRLGGLASMMSGKKQSISKSELLNQTKSAEELKSYAALSSLGRPIYSQVKRKKNYSGPSAQTELTEISESKRVAYLHQVVTATDLAQKLSVKFQEMADRALDLNLLLKPVDFLGIKLATQIAALYGYRVEDKAFDEKEALGKKEISEEEKSKYPLRSPIITIMGHVDHGKTTLIDHIRKAKVVDGEAGGITQHIGAYQVDVSGKVLTFLDTPGHAAFASMRQRGADCTDIVILVVAADDGVMPQTKESVRFIQNAGKPLIVAVNKMDKEGANPDRIKTELAEFSITPEEWGGDTQFVPISALNGDGVDNLLEAIALQAEIMDLREDPKGSAEGVVIESKIEQGRGPIATILLQSGTLKKGDNIVVGETFGRARSLMDYRGTMLKEAGPSTPVQILGLDQAPGPGDSLNVVKNEREAKKVVQNRIDERKKLESVPEQKKISLEDFFGTAPADEVEQKVLNLVIRTDVQGSFEAIKQALEALSNVEVAVKIIGGGVGAISDSDVMLADSAGGIILGFNMRPINTARRIAEAKGVDIKTYSIIYELINEVTLALEGLLEPEYNEKFIGRSEIKETFMVPKVGMIAGCIVVDGKIQVRCKIRLLRDGKILHDGSLSSLKRFKDDVKEVKSGLECGMGLENYNDLKVGDTFEAYILEERKRTLEDVPEEVEAPAPSAETDEDFNEQETTM